MSDVLAVLLCRLFMTCAGVTAGLLDKGVSSTAVAVASSVALLVSLSRPVCPPPASRSRFLPVSLLALPVAACTSEVGVQGSVIKLLGGGGYPLLRMKSLEILLSHIDCDQIIKPSYPLFASEFTFHNTHTSVYLHVYLYPPLVC